MSEILKAKNRILNRSKIFPGQTNQENNDPSPLNEFNQEAFQPEAATYSKKFNISSISMKFTRNQQEQDQQKTPIKFDKIQLNPNQKPLDYANNSQRDNKKKELSPEFSHTERINPIRHFEPYNLSALSESNSQSSLYKWSKNKSRKTNTRSQDQQFDKRLVSKIPLEGRINESPINKIRKIVHFERQTLLIVKKQIKRAQSPYKPKECHQEYTEKFIKVAKQKQKSFVDQSFPPQKTIIFPKKFLYESEPNLVFERLSKMYEALEVQITLLQGCEPTFISPGKFTNPCLYSALRILSQNPQRVLSLFQNQKINQQGIYYVRICKDGCWRYIIIDDNVPIKLSSNTRKNAEILGLSCTDANEVVELWPSLVQKALAKVYGTYYDLLLSRRDGLCPLFRALTGFPVSKYDLIKDVRSYLVLIDAALKREHIVVLEEILPEFEYLAQLKSLSRHESYQVLEIQRNNFLLRNLADFDLVTKLSFDEVMMFSSLLLFRKESDYIYISQKLRHKKGYFSSISVKVPANTQCYWDVWQNNPAYYKNHLETQLQYEVAPYKIVIQPTKVQKATQYDSVVEPQTIVESGKQISMKKGEYLLSIHLCQKRKELDFTISYYGQEDVEITRIKNSSSKWAEDCCSQERIDIG